MSFVKKISIFLIIYFVVTQLFLTYMLPSSLVYNQRIIYDVVKNNMNNFDAVLIQINKLIKKDHLKKYVIILGDSVGFSIPCPPKNSLAFYMNEISKKEGSNTKAFNLSMPSMTAGDIYTMIKLLEKYKISTENLIIDIPYFGFTGNAAVFWLQDTLRELDAETYKEVFYEKYHVKKSFKNDSLKLLKHKLDSNISLLTYKDYLTFPMKNYADKLLGGDTQAPQAWSTKAFLPALMENKDNKWYYTDRPFVFDTSNPEIYFLNKIIEEQKGKNALIFLPAMNDKLLAEGVKKPGYIANMKNIDEYFKDKPVKFVNYNGKIDYNFFSDHIHLIPEGYKYLAGDLWAKMDAK